MGENREQLLIMGVSGNITLNYLGEKKGSNL